MDERRSQVNKFVGEVAQEIRTVIEGIFKLLAININQIPSRTVNLRTTMEETIVRKKLSFDILWEGTEKEKKDFKEKLINTLGNEFLDRLFDGRKYSDEYICMKWIDIVPAYEEGKEHGLLVYCFGGWKKPKTFLTMNSEIEEAVQKLVDKLR